VADGLLLLLAVAQNGDLGEDPCDAAGGPAAGRRPPAATKRGQHGESIGQDDRKRGVRGFDMGKQIKGRKRHLLVDTLGIVLGVIVHAANIQDRDGAKLGLERLRHKFSRLRCIGADGGSTGPLVAWVRGLRVWRKLRLEIVSRPEGAKGFLLLPKRWVVERTFAWLSRYRRLSKDYEYLTQTSEALIHVALINLMVRRLARK
jgi:putative transposase